MLILRQIDVITTKNNDSIKKLGNIKSEHILFLNQIWANESFFHCTGHINWQFSQLLVLTLNKHSFTAFTTSWWVNFPDPVLWLFYDPLLGMTISLNVREIKLIHVSANTTLSQNHTKWVMFSLKRFTALQPQPNNTVQEVMQKTFWKWLHLKNLHKTFLLFCPVYYHCWLSKGKVTFNQHDKYQ